MAEEFQAGICGGNWWNSPKSSLGSLPCSTALNDIGSFGWATDMVEIKARSCDESAASVSHDSSIVFQDIQKPHHQQQQADSASGESSALMDSTLQMMGFGLSSSATSDWNQTNLVLRGSGKVESNYHSMLQDDMSSRLNYREEPAMEAPNQIQKDWSQKDYVGGNEDSSTNAFKPINQGFSLDQKRLNSITSAGECAVSCQGLPTSFPVGSASYGYPSTLLQTLFEPDPQPQQSLFDNRLSMNYQSTANYRENSSEFMPSWHKFSPIIKPSLPKQQPSSHLHFSNNTPYWNASAAAVNDIRTGFLSSPPSQFLTPTFEEKPNRANLTAKRTTEEVRDSGSAVKKSSSEPAFKRPRIETPSPLPTFKVRKEKLGDRITALQQLVSPFGKTDTASVLHEAIEYIKFLHDQVSVLSTPYMKNGAPIQHQQTSDKLKDPEGPKQDLRSRGLCLMPISSTFPVANEPTADFWTPTFGGTFR